jgi:hypothetical protein
MQRNLALRGSSDNTGTQNAHVFLNIMEAIRYHNRSLKNRVSKHNAGSVKYLSNKIQNKYIILLGNNIRAELSKQNIFHCFRNALLMIPDMKG